MAGIVGDFVVDRLHEWGVKRIYGYPGDGINGLYDAPMDHRGVVAIVGQQATLGRGGKVAILVGSGALGASEELRQVADLLGAGMAKALLGRAVLPDDLAFTGRRRWYERE